MLFPTADQYADLILNKAPGTFYVLNDYNFLFTSEGKTIANYKQGYSAAIFKAEKNEHPYAIRCFLSVDVETFRRYEAVCQYINSKNLSWKTPCEFLDKEMRINGEQYPVVKMEWKKGNQLNDFIDQIVLEPARLSKLQQDLVGLSINLEENMIGHGDLNFSHIMISGDVTDFSITLLDYDSLYIAEFEGQNSLVSGSPGFQHPLRLSSDFSEKIDRFSIWIMLAGLEAIKTDPQLWKQPEQIGYDKKENLLFTFRDLINPERSRLFQQLKTSKSEALQYYLQHIETFCSASTLDEITKPELYKSQSKHFIYQEIKKSSPALPAEKLFDVEIKTIPAGRDVLVNGTKKGITPLRIALAKKDFGHVEVMNAYEKMPLVISEQKQTYEIDFLKKQKENIPEKSTTEQNEILDFGADRYLVSEGEIVTIRWKVKGTGKINISPIGEVYDQSGSKEFVLKKTTNYVLSIGDKNRTFIIHVHPKQGERKQNPEKFTFPAKKGPTLKSKQIFLLLGLVIVAIGIYFMYGYFSKNAAEITPVNPSVTQASSLKSSPFPVGEVTKFLNRLYGAYNQRNLPSIMKQYAGTVDEYYDSKSINKDSLSAIIKNLFITPAYYSCQPDYTKLSISPNSERCSLELEIMEVLQKDKGSSRDTFNTKIIYMIDKNFHIISEKSAEDKSEQ